MKECQRSSNASIDYGNERVKRIKEQPEEVVDIA